VSNPTTLPDELPRWVAERLCQDGYLWSSEEHERQIKSTPSFPEAVQAMWRECVRLQRGGL